MTTEGKRIFGHEPNEDDFRASLPTDVEWTFMREGSVLVATDVSGEFSPRRFDTRTSAVTSRTSGKLRG